MLRSVFADAEWLHLLWIAPLLLLLLRGYVRWRHKALAALGPRSGKLFRGFQPGRFWLKNSLVVVALICISIAIANPRWGQKNRNQTQKAADVMIAMDISKSMLAADIRPNRLIRSRLFAQELIKKLAGNRVGLLFFAGEAYLSMPLSTDYQTVTSLLAEADPESYSVQGTAIEAVVELAKKSFDPSPGAGRALVIITDGEDHEEDPRDAVENAFSDHGIVTFMVGAGTAEGAKIPMPGGTSLQDENGQPVVSKLGINLLSDLAEAGQGAAPFFLNDLDNPAQRLADAINALEKRDISIRSFDEKNSYYQWLLLPAILLLFAEGWLSWKRKEK